MKKILFALLLSAITFSAIGQDAATLSQKAAGQYVLYESERDRGGQTNTMYDYLFQSYTLYIRVLEAPGNGQYLEGAKNRLRSIYPNLLNATVYYMNSGNAAKASDFGDAYISMPKRKEFRTDYLEKDQSYNQILFNTAIASYKTQRYSKAIDYFNDYINSSNDEQVKDCYVFLNLIYQSQKDYPNQERILKKSIEKYPLNLDFYYNLVNVYIATGNNAGMSKTIDDILAINPNDMKVLPIRARLAEHMGDDLEALSIYKRLLSFNPDNFDFMTGVARCDFRYATSINNKAATLVDDAAYEEANRKALPYILEAKDMFQKILAKEPTSKKYMQGLLGVYQYMNLTGEYEVLRRILVDGASYKEFDSRLNAYNRQLAASTSNRDASVPMPTNPAKLVIKVDNNSYADANHNKIIDAGEGFTINFSITNQGLGDAYNVRVRLSEINGFESYLEGPKELDGGHITAGQTKQYSFRYITSEDIPTGRVKLDIYAFEANGFDADPASLQLYTQELSRPRLIIPDYQFFPANGTSISLGDNGKLRIAIQNVGTMTAYNVKVNFKGVKNMIATDIETITIDSIPSGSAHPIDYSFLVNKRFTEDSLKVVATLTESSNTSPLSTVCKTKLGAYLSSASTLQLEGQLANRKVNIKDITLAYKCDLLDNVPIGSQNPHRYALIIGNEDYSMVSESAEINVPYAKNDAVVFKEYCVQTFGIPNNHIKLIINATSGMMRENLDWLVNISKADKDAELFFYYSGHGNSDEATKEPYLLPVDITGKNIQLGLSIDYLYKSLSQNQIKGAYVFLDACFSGGYKSAAPLIAQKGIRVKPQTTIPTGNVLSFASSSGDQTSSVFHEKKQGYYTYYLIKALKDSGGKVSMSELFSRTRDDVRKATALLGKMQEPQYIVSPNWKDWGSITLMH